MSQVLDNYNLFLESNNEPLSAATIFYHLIPGTIVEIEGPATKICKYWFVRTVSLEEIISCSFFF